MSWYADTQLFINNGLYVYKIRNEYGTPVILRDFEYQELLSFSKHLSLGNNRESDYATFKSSVFTNGVYKAINSQGLVITLSVVQESKWSREEQNSLFYNLPGVTRYESVTAMLAIKERVSELEAKVSSLQDEAKSNNDKKQAMDKRLADLEAQNSILKDEAKRFANGLNAEKSTDQKHEELLSRLAALEALDSRVLDLTSKLVHHCGAGGESSVDDQPWITGDKVPRNWVSFDELDVIKFSKTTPLTITKDAGAPKFLEDNTTNVRVIHFYRGVYPIALVNVEELAPDRKEARFDRDVWGCYNNAGINYAARKQFASEISVDPYKTC